MNFASYLHLNHHAQRGRKANAKSVYRSCRCENTSGMAIKNSPALSSRTLNRYLNLPQPEDRVQCTYVWIHDKGDNLRSKSRTFHFEPTKPEELPVWYYGTFKTSAADSPAWDVYLHPVAVFPDPFRMGRNKLVLCETYHANKVPTEWNKRHLLTKSMERAAHLKPWFGFEQEYFLLDVEGRPFGWPKDATVDPTHPYFNGVGANIAYGRPISEAHYRACMYAGIDIGGTNAEGMPAQWEYQVGPCEGTSVGDQIWMSRFLLLQIAEEFGVVVSFDPKPVPEDFNGSGGHMNFSTEAMRQPGGLVHIEAAIEKLSKHHRRHIEAYDPNRGKDNERRMTGNNLISSTHVFSVETDTRGGSIRIPSQVAEEKMGYFEDRRPSANCDPYAVADVMIRTICLEE